MNSENFLPYSILIVMIIHLSFKYFKFKRAKRLLPDLIAKGAVVVDVRTASEYASGARPGSLNIPLAEITKRLKELDATKPIIVCCASGTRSGLAAGILKKAGYKEVTNAGTWTNTL